MSKIRLFLLIAIIMFICSVTYLPSYGNDRAPSGWKAGTAETVITPDKPIWMAGFASRTHPAEGKLHDIWVKALALEDASGKQAVLVTADLLGFPKNISDEIREKLEEKHHLSKAQIILNSSHTHSAPVLRDALSDIYPLNEEQVKEISDYSDWLVEQVVNLV